MFGKVYFKCFAYIRSLNNELETALYVRYYNQLKYADQLIEAQERNISHNWNLYLKECVDEIIDGGV